MKKLFACILATTLAFSVTLMTACTDDTAGTDEPFSVEQTSTSSARQRGSGAGSASAGNQTSDGGQSAGNQSGTSGSQGGGNSASANTSEEYSYGNYNYSYSNSTVNVEYVAGNKVSELDADIYYFSLDYKKPVLTDSFYKALIFCEGEYNALDATQKGQLKNAAFLLEARQAYDNMVKEEATNLIDQLPDPTMDNITEFGTLAAAIADLLKTIADPSVVSNYSAYQTKLEASSTLLVDAFANAVAAIATFEYSAEYKGKLDYADSVYGFLNDGQKAKVTTNYQTLTSMQAKYDNTAAAYVFVDALGAIADENNLTDNDKATVKELKKQFKNLTAAVVNEIPADAMTKYNTMVQKANALWPEYYVNFAESGAGGNQYFKVYKSDGGTGELGGTSDGSSYPGYFDGDSLTTAYKLKTDRYIIIETDAPAVLTIVANYKNGDGDITVKQGTLSFNDKGKASFAAGSFSTSFTVTMQSGEATNYTVNLPAAGTYQISSDNSNVMVYYMMYQ